MSNISSSQYEFVRCLIVKLHNAGLNGTQIYKCIKKGLDLPLSSKTVYKVIGSINEQK